jgi:hypothetical protein
MLNATECASATLIPLQSTSSLDLLPDIDWSEQWVTPRITPHCGWLVTRNHDSVTVRQGGNVIAIPAAELTQFLAVLDRLGG